MPKSKAMWPLFEMVSNAIHAIEERHENVGDGLIQIKLFRNGSEELHEDYGNKFHEFPINSISVKDNGIGFTKDNWDSFLTAESEKKIVKGAKGVGRFVSLKVFYEVLYDSVYKSGETYRRRSFKFQPKHPGIFNLVDEELPYAESVGTSLTLNNIRREYEDSIPRCLDDIADSICIHFLILLKSGKAPMITIQDIAGATITLQDYFANTLRSTIKDDYFTIKDERFDVFMVKVYDSRATHRLYYCANDREVKYDVLTNYLPDLGKRIIEEGGSFVYFVYTSSPFLDKHVNSERVSFSLPQEEESGETGEEDGNEQEDSLTMKSIRKQVVACIEDLIQPYLEGVRAEKFREYENHIIRNAPQYRTILKYAKDSILKLPPNLSGNRLDIELFKLQSKLEYQNKKLGDKVLNAEGEATSTEEYRNNYKEFIEKFNDLGKANLAQYIVHRKAVIKLLSKLIEFNEGFEKEDVVHNIFFPIRSESDEVEYSQQNLWLIDERLSYHTYLASDKTLNSNRKTTSTSADRPDIFIYDKSLAFVENSAPYESYTIVEFKRPERADYSMGSSRNPVEQVIRYIRTIREGNAKDRKGKAIDFFNTNTPFYVYIIADMNKKLRDILEDKDFKKTPDQQGYFLYHDKYNAYIEVLTYQKVLKDATNRNRVLFDKLGIPTN